MADDLETLRSRIDEVDQALVTLLAERVRLVLQVGEYKRERALPAHDAAREEVVLRTLAEKATSPLTPNMTRSIFLRIIEESRALEQEHINRI